MHSMNITHAQMNQEKPEQPIAQKSDAGSCEDFERSERSTAQSGELVVRSGLGLRGDLRSIPATRPLSLAVPQWPERRLERGLKYAPARNTLLAGLFPARPSFVLVSRGIHGRDSFQKGKQ